MKSPLTIALLLAVDVALSWSAVRLVHERERLARRLDGIAERIESERRTGEGERRRSELIERAAPLLKRDASDIASLRDLLIGAERGLDLDRLSLDFRSAGEGSSSANRGRVEASLAGTFDGVHEYLRRIEALRLPLATENLSLRRDRSERLLVDVQWLVRWQTPGDLDTSFSAEEARRLEAYLASGGEAVPERDPFAAPGRAVAEVPPSSEASPPVEELPPPEDLAPIEPAPAGPELAGFVLARPELESDVDRRVLAAVRLDGELVLIGAGEEVGGYRVERIDLRESVTLLDLETGEALVLRLE